MIEINLLPEELRKKKKTPKFKAVDVSSLDFSNFSPKNLKKLIENFAPAKWAVLGIGLLIAFQMILFVVGIYGQISLRSINKKYDEIALQKKEADSLRAQSESINRKVGAINELMVKRFSWARKLNEISDSMTTGVWLSELSYDNKVAERIIQKSSSKGKKGSSTEKMIVNYLMLTGYTSQMGESGASLVGKFIRGLKTNEAFYDDFSDITLVSIKSDKVDSQEVMNFNITCPFKEGKD